MVRRTVVIGSIALVLAACGGREQSPTPARGGKTVTSTSAAPPADLRNAKINKIIQPDLPTFLESATLGDEIGKDGNVSHPTDEIPEGHKVYFTMRLRQSPVGLQTRAVWKDTFGHELAMEERAMGGTKVVTFATKKPLKAGRYTVVGYWGGNVAAEHLFEVVAPKKK